MAETRQPPVAPVEHFNEQEHRRLLANRANASLALSVLASDLVAGDVPVWDGAVWGAQPGITGFLQLAGTYEYTSGTETVLDLSAGPSTRAAYLLYSQYRQFGDADYRHGTIAIASRANSRPGAGNEGFVVVNNFANLSGRSGDAFSGSEYLIRYTGGGGVPNTTIYYWRIS